VGAAHLTSIGESSLPGRSGLPSLNGYSSTSFPPPILISMGRSRVSVERSYPLKLLTDRYSGAFAAWMNGHDNVCRREPVDHSASGGRVSDNTGCWTRSGGIRMRRRGSRKARCASIVAFAGRQCRRASQPRPASRQHTRRQRVARLMRQSGKDAAVRTIMSRGTKPASRALPLELELREGCGARRPASEQQHVGNQRRRRVGGSPGRGAVTVEIIAPVGSRVQVR